MQTVVYVSMSRERLVELNQEIGKALAEKPTGPIEVRFTAPATTSHRDACAELVLSNEDMEDRDDLQGGEMFFDLERS